jgi:hypothetical protein
MRTTTLLSIALVFASAVPATGQEADADPQRATVGALRTAGVTLYEWVFAQAQRGGPFASRSAGNTEFDWTACPGIELATVRAILGDEKGRSLPEHDGWGHRIEYCLRVEDQQAAGHLVGVRSPGRDGAFDATRYTPGGFDAARLDHDLVWIDGVFVTWPRRQPN